MWNSADLRNSSKGASIFICPTYLFVLHIYKFNDHKLFLELLKA